MSPAATKPQFSGEYQPAQDLEPMMPAEAFAKFLPQRTDYAYFVPSLKDIQRLEASHADPAITGSKQWQDEMQNRLPTEQEAIRALPTKKPWLLDDDARETALIVVRLQDPSEIKSAFQDEERGEKLRREFRDYKFATGGLIVGLRKDKKNESEYFSNFQQYFADKLALNVAYREWAQADERHMVDGGDETAPVAETADSLASSSNGLNSSPETGESESKTGELKRLSSMVGRAILSTAMVTGQKIRNTLSKEKV